MTVCHKKMPLTSLNGLEINEPATRAANFLTESMMAHMAAFHGTRGAQKPITFRLRFVELRSKKEVRQLPPSGSRSTSQEMLFSLQETQKVQTLLKTFNKSRKLLLKL